MPNAKKLPSGNWQVKVYSHTEYVDGKPKRIRESFTASTKAEAEYQAALFKRKNKRRLPRELTLGDATSTARTAYCPRLPYGATGR